MELTFEITEKMINSLTLINKVFKIAHNLKTI